MKNRSSSRFLAILGSALIGLSTALLLSPAASGVVGGPGTGIYSAASLQSPDGTHFCGGAVVNSTSLPNSWIITAKHCVQERSPASMKVRSGNNRLTDPVFEVDKIIVHPTADLALVRAGSGNIRASANGPASWPNSTNGLPIAAAGWGQTCPSPGCATYPVDLHYLDTWFVPDSACAISDAYSEICVNNPDGGGVCYGDDGSPLLWDHGAGIDLVGIVTKVGGTICGAQPSVAIDIPVFYQWIKATMKNNS